MKPMDFLVNELETLRTLNIDLELVIERLQDQKHEIDRKIEENIKKQSKLVQKITKKRKATVVTVGEIHV